MTDIVRRLLSFRPVYGFPEEYTATTKVPITVEAAAEIALLTRERDKEVELRVDSIDRMWAAENARASAEEKVVVLREALSDMDHAANEWADCASNAYQWIKNIRDSTSTPAEALTNLDECFIHCRSVWSTARTALETTKPGFQPTHRHVKSGGLYTVIMSATREHDLEPLIVYRGEDGRVWVRHHAEFHDGRFQPLREKT